MDSTTQSRYASALTIVVGLWAILVPAFTPVTGAALANILIVGGIIALAGLVQLFWENTLPSWINGLAAVWLFGSAFIFGVSTAVAWNMALAAVAAFILALWDGIEVNQAHHMHQSQLS